MYLVRDALEIEVYQLVDLSQAVLKESPTYTHMAFDKEKSAFFFAKGINKEKQWFLRVIVEKVEGTVVGFILCVCEPSIFGPDKIAYDVTIMVDEAHRGKCTKQVVQLIYDYKEWALKEGAKVVKMGVSSLINIEKAELFFDKLGFTKIGSQHAIIVGE
jgi:hypothetical protein